MVSSRERGDTGIFLNADALDRQTRTYLAQLLNDVLKVAGEKSILPDITVPNPLPIAMGLRGKFFVWTNLVALKKPEGGETETGKVTVEAGVTYELEQWEEKVAITDESKINGQMGASDLLNAGNAGRGFARAIDGEGLNAIFDGVTGTAGTDWTSETDANILDQIGARQDTIESAGFDPDTIILTTRQLNRLSSFTWVTNGKGTAVEYLKTVLDFVNVIRAKKVAYDKDGSRVDLFDPTDNVVFLDKAACAVFSQRPTTMELERNVAKGIDLAYMRKFFKTKVVQSEAMDKLTGVVI